MIKIIIGDLFNSKMHTLVNTINCDGIMGKGVAKVFKDKYPEMFKDYRSKFENNELEIGKPYLFQDDHIKILNFPTKQHWRSPSILKNISDGLDYFIAHYQDWGIISIAFPPLGCGNGGLNWIDVAPLMIEKLIPLDLKIEMYAPYGTDEKLLDINYLMSIKKELDLSLKGKSQMKLPKFIYPIIEIVYQLQNNPYAPYVGRVIFQKIAYIFTQMINDNELNFKESHYGPYSDILNKSLNILANSNIILEEKYNGLYRIKVLDDYIAVREKHKDQIEAFSDKLEKIVDLFTRIKDTEQAEEVATVLYTSKKLKQNGNPVKETDLLNAIYSWKKSWNKEDKTARLVNTIRNLTALHWINTIYCPELKGSNDFI